MRKSIKIVNNCDDVSTMKATFTEKQLKSLMYDGGTPRLNPEWSYIIYPQWIHSKDRAIGTTRVSVRKVYVLGISKDETQGSFFEMTWSLLTNRHFGFVEDGDIEVLGTKRGMQVFPAIGTLQYSVLENLSLNLDSEGSNVKIVAPLVFNVSKLAKCWVGTMKELPNRAEKLWSFESTAVGNKITINLEAKRLLIFKPGTINIEDYREFFNTNCPEEHRL